MPLNWKQFGFGIAETVLSLVPGGKAVKKGFKALSRATGMAKDLFNTGENKLSGLAEKFGEYKEEANREIGDLKEGLQGMGDRVGGLEKGLKGMGDRMGNLEGEMKGLGDRTGALEKGMGSLKEGLDNVRSDLEGVKSDIQTQGRELKQAMGEMKSELQDQIQEQAEVFDQKLQAQDAKFTQEITRIDSEIASLHGEQKRQKEELKAEIQQKNEQTKRQLRKEMQQQKEQLENAIHQVVQAQKKVNEAVQEHLNELDERMDKVEKKTIENARKIFQEQLERERKDEELTEAIKSTNTKLKNLQQENFDLADDFSKHQGEINRQTAQTQQDLENLEAECTQQTSVLNTKISENQDRLDDYEEEQQNIKAEQKKLDIEFRDMLEEVETHTYLISEQAKKLEFVARGMEEISEETNSRIDKLHREMFDLEEQTEEALFTAKKAARKVDNLTEELAKEKARIEELEQQIEKNKQETEKAKKEAQQANERIDNLLKAQQLSDFTEQELAFAKLQKTLQLKADEAKLLAQLNILQQSHGLISQESAEREWKVGIEKGTEKEIPRSEGMPLNPNSRWAKTFTPEQLSEWGWDTRLLGKHESAPLTDPEKRKPETTQTGAKKESQISELEAQAYQQVETIKSQLLEQLAQIQEQIEQNVSSVEQVVEEEEEKKAISGGFAPSKAGKSALAKATQKQIQTKQQQITALNQELSQAQPNSSQAKTIQQNISQLEQEIVQEQFEYELQEAEAQVAENQQEILQEEWEEIQELQEEVLEEEPAPPLPAVSKAMEAAVQAAEAVADSSSESSSAQEKQMTYFMLFLIIFLLEYIVYKRNGLPGLIILNICLAIAYYHKDTLKEYVDLWDKYVLIAGYVMGNVLAYSAPEQEKYKVPSVVGFNALIALIYGYTWWQKRKIAQASQQKLDQIATETVQTIREQNQAYEAESKKVEKEYIQHQQQVIEKLEQRPQLQPKQQQLEKELEQAQQEIQSQAPDAHQQAETQRKIKAIQQTLQEIKKTKLTSAVDIDLLETKEPGIKDHWTRIKDWLRGIIPKSETSDRTQKITAIIEPLPLTEAEIQVLNSLYLSPEQTFAISTQAERIKYHQVELKATYSQLNTAQKLKLLNAGLESLGLKSIESKTNLAQLRQQLYQEAQSFDLTLKEKENVLRLLITNLNLSAEQREKLEDLGISFFDASNWQVSEEQKNQLLSFGLNKVELTPEQEEKLSNLHSDAFKTFAFTEQQKTILQSLAPLTKEFKYSKQALNSIRSLGLKPANLSFLVQEEVLPDTNTAFGETKSPYLSLKLKYLQGEKKVLEQQAKEQQKQASQEQLIQDKQSIIHSLMEFANKYSERGLNVNFTLADWVKLDALQGWQRDVLLTIGFKTVPKYNFFELLALAVEKFGSQSWTDFLAEHTELTADYQAYLHDQNNQQITINEAMLDKFVSSQTQKEREIFKALNLQELIQEQIRQEIAGYQLTLTPDYTPVPNWEKWQQNINSDFTESLARTWINHSFSYETTKEWIAIGLSIYEAEFASWLRDEAKLTPEEVLSFKEEKELREQFKEYQKNKSPKTKPNSRYDDILTGLGQEEAERQRRKLEREETLRKLDEAQLSRRQANLSAKDQKLLQEQSRHQKEKALQEQEALKRKQAFEQRQQELKDQETSRLKAKQEALERTQKLAEEALLIKQREIALEEQKKKEQIEKLEKANKLEQERLQKQAQLIEEETKKKLESVALEDEEERQRILKDQEKKNAELERERLEAERNFEREKSAKELAAKAREQEQKEELKRLELKFAEAERKKQEQAREQELEILANQAKSKEITFHAYCDKFVESVLPWVSIYHWNQESQFIQGIPTSFYPDDGWSSIGASGRGLRENYPNLRFNIYRWLAHRTSTFEHSGHNTRFLAFTLGDGFYTIEEMKEIVKRKCPSKAYIVEQLKKVGGSNNFL